MATEVYKTEEITLFSGKKIKMRPLKIRLLRRFMEAFEKMADVAKSNADSMDVLIDCVIVALEQYDPDLAKDRDLVEDEFDLPNCYKVVEVAAGIKLGDDENPQPPARSGRN